MKLASKKTVNDWRRSRFMEALSSLSFSRQFGGEVDGYCRLQ